VATITDLMISVGIDTDRVAKGAATISRSLDKTFQGVGRSAAGMVTSITSVGSAVPLLAGVTAGAMSLGTAVAGAGLAFGVFQAVAKSAMTEVNEAVTQTETLQDKVDKYGQAAKTAAAAGQSNKAALEAQAKATMELRAHLDGLPPDVRQMTQATMDLKSNWQSFVDANKPAVYGMMTSAYETMGEAIDDLQPLFDAGMMGAQSLLGAVQGLVEGDRLKRWGENAMASIDPLVGIIINTGTAIGGMFGKIGAAQGQGVLEWLDDLTYRWSVWATATESDAGIQKFVEFMTTSGASTAALLGDIASAAFTVAQAVAPLAPISMAVAGALAAIIAAVPPDLITAVVSGWIAYGIAVKAWAAWQAVATAVQWAQNSALLAWPGTWIIAGIVALIAVIVLLATKTKFFQTVWAAVWGFMKGVGAWFAGPFADFFVRSWGRITASLTKARGQLNSVVSSIKGFFVGLGNSFSSVASKISSRASALASYFGKLPGRISNSLKGTFNGLWSGFRGVVNKIVGGWNRIQFPIGGGSFAGISIPSVSFGTPNIPYLAKGGIVPATPGGRLAVIGEGGRDEAVIPLDRGLPDLGRDDDDRQIVVEIMGAETEFKAWLRRSIRVGNLLQDA